MKIVVGYPPTTSGKGIALLSQNRQFQWFSHETKMFPVVLGGAATMARQAGHDVLWKDCIADGTDEEGFRAFLRREKPELFVFETKTPVVKLHWQTVDALKREFPDLRIAMLGDHVSNLPEETMEACGTDYVICGGHYDFALTRLLKAIQSGGPMPAGVFYRQDSGYAGNRDFVCTEDLDAAPYVDRDLTQWQLYQKEYNLQGRPFMYTMSGRDCWYGKCVFCAWTTIYPKFAVRSVENVVGEVEMLVGRYGVNEIFDDSGSLNVGSWLHDLCRALISSGLNRKTRYSCNMRFGALGLDDFKLMREAGFRLLKFGLESANQDTLDRLNKKIKVQDIVDGCKMAKKAGLTVHLTMIVGHPWEGREDAARTFNLAKRLMQSGDADVLQATTIVPYPGTPLYQEALANDGFLFDPRAYERFDMGEPVLKSRMTPAEVREICNKIYTIFLTPRYVLARLRNIRSWEDLRFTLRGAGAVLGHLKDFAGERKAPRP
ncbi:MAG: radical SAM protein [Kiritimatiellae bacterium]|nr:radical SAM protein [Kiritimatiellia bacterium]